MAGRRLRSWPRTLAAAAFLAGAASCSDLPTKPVPLVSVAGTVWGREGMPLNAMVLVFRPSGLSPYEAPPPPPRSGETFTNADGVFAISLYAGEYDVQIFPLSSQGEYGRAAAGGVRISPERPRFDYRYTGARVQGAIRGPGGIPVSGASVGGYRVDAAFEFRETESTNGQYSMVLTPGDWDMHVDAPSSPQGLPNIYLGVTHIAADTTIDISLAGEPVTATVTGPGVQPVAGAVLYLRSSFAYCYGTSASDGTALLYLPVGNYRGTVYPSQGYLASRNFAASVTGPTSLNLDLSGVDWTGTVRYAGSGLPAAGARVDASSVSGPGSRAYVTVDASGTFHLVVVPGAVYDLGIGRLDVGWFGAAADTTFDLSVDSTAVWGPGGIFLEARRVTPRPRPQ